jgi:hypothetical protein
MTTFWELARFGGAVGLRIPLLWRGIYSAIALRFLVFDPFRASMAGGFLFCLFSPFPAW